MEDKIYLQCGEKDCFLPYGVTVRQALEALSVEIKSTYLDNPIVAVSVNNEILPLSFHLDHDGNCIPIHLFSNLGKRTYRHSICYLLCLASHLLFPKRRLLIGHSLGDGYYLYYDDPYDISSEEIEQLSNKMKEIVASNIPIAFKKEPYDKAIKYFYQRGAMETVQLLRCQNSPNIPLYETTHFRDLAYEPLVDKTGVLSLWELRSYEKNGMLLRYPNPRDFTVLQPFVDDKQLFLVFKEYRKWNKTLKMRTLGALNNLCIEGNITNYIRMAETLQQKKISDIADMIFAHKGVKAIFIAGPSSSGKTTFAFKLGVQLQMRGKEPIRITLDNYYKPSDQIPFDSNGKKDFECLESLDIPLFEEHLSNLMKGIPVKLPHYNFKTKERLYPQPALTLNESSVIIIEGIHGLNPRLIKDIDQSTTFKVYISALTQINIDDHNRISTTDNRILRRIVRDYRTRGTSAYRTLSMWNSVHEGEKKHIFPFQNEADVVLNSALDYEIGVIRPLALPLLKTVKPENSEVYAVSRRLIAFLSIVPPISETLVPANSLIREFIGGSEFDVT